MYTAELSHVVAQHDLKFHQYADDCQIYVSTLVNAVHSAIARFSCCLEDVEAWMTASRLRLNASKTQVMWLGSRHNLDTVTVSEVQVLTSTVRVVSWVRDLGVVNDIRLTMADYVASVWRSAYYHLRQIRPTVQSLTPDGSKTLTSPGIHLRVPRLLLLAALRNDRQSVLASTVGAERSGQADNTDRSAWAHHTRSKGTTLAARSTPRRLQAGHVHVQDAAQPDTTGLVGRLSAHLRRKWPTTVVRHVYICRATDQNWVTDHFAVAGPQIWNSLPAICA